MTPKLKQGLTVAAAVCAAALGGTALAGAAGNGNSNGGGRDRPPRGNETALTGSTAEKVKQAALARVDGIILRVETDEGGVYEAHIRKADGTEVEVKVNRQFKVTAVEAGRGRHP
ncbi:MAG TPA: hypothetical protein VHJ39_16730 [Solirubrobacteraceae bacterium]|nr:hypothetical protein [Solirubrobacteraceae bacterium]